MEQSNDTIYDNLDEENLRKILRSMGVTIDIDGTPKDELIKSIRFNEKYKSLLVEPDDDLIVESGKKGDEDEGIDDEETLYVVDEEMINNLTPPDGYSPEEARAWWINQCKEEGIPMGNFPTTSSYERMCLYCSSINPCTGVSTCSQCGRDITNPKNFLPVVFSNRHHPSGH